MIFNYSSAETVKVKTMSRGILWSCLLQCTLLVTLRNCMCFKMLLFLLLMYDWLLHPSMTDWEYKC